MADIKKIAEELVNLSVKDVSELANILKDEYGIEPAAAAATTVVAAGAGAAAGDTEEKTSFNITLKSGGASKLAVVKLVKEITGFTIGGVSPVGHLKPIKIFIDESLSRFPNIFGAAGHPNCVFKITYNQLIKITKGTEKEISE